MQDWCQERGLNVNKNMLVLASGTAVAVLGIAGCSQGSSETYRYEVSGTVESAQVDYECKGDLNTDPIAFVAGRGGGTGSSTRKSSGGSRSSSKAKAGSSEARTPSARSTTPATAPTGKSKTPSSARATAALKPNKGVSLSKKPDKPERVTKVKPPKYKSKPKGCRNEYELFVRNKDGLFEQDVRQVDYERCSDKPRELFPACTSN